MAIKGLRTPIFGEYNYDGNAVTYTDGFVAGAAIEYSAELETSDNNPLFGDDSIIENDYGTLSSGTLTLGNKRHGSVHIKAALGIERGAGTGWGNQRDRTGV